MVAPRPRSILLARGRLTRWLDNIAQSHCCNRFRRTRSLIAWFNKKRKQAANCLTEESLLLARHRLIPTLLLLAKEGLGARGNTAESPGHCIQTEARPVRQSRQCFWTRAAVLSSPEMAGRRNPAPGWAKSPGISSLGEAQPPESNTMRHSGGSQSETSVVYFFGMLEMDTEIKRQCLGSRPNNMPAFLTRTA